MWYEEHIEWLENLAEKYDKNAVLDLGEVSEELRDKFQKSIDLKLISQYFEEKGFDKIIFPEEDDIDVASFFTNYAEELATINGKDYKNNNDSLIHKYHSSKDKNILNEIILENKGLVSKVVQRNKGGAGYLLDDSDLTTEAHLGLITAVEKFDFNKGCSFSTYAYIWMNQKITRAIMDQGTLVRVPVHMHERIKKINRIENEHINLYGYVDKELLCEECGISEKYYRNCKIVEQQFLNLRSINMNLDTEENTLDQFLTYGSHHILGESEFYKEVEEIVLYSDMKEYTECILGILTEREENVLRLRFGMDDGRLRTLEEIGRVFGVTRERIRQIEMKAIRKLRDRITYEAKKKDMDLADLTL